MAKISFIIPVYNTAKYLDQCMQSVLGQTFSDIEVILVDDGSTDNVSPAMCDEYTKKDSRVRVIHKTNGGLMSAWIEGTKAATADYLSYVDSDDWIDLCLAKELMSHTNPSFSDSEIISSNYIVEKAGERRKETQSLAPGEYTGNNLKQLHSHLLGDEVRPVIMSRCMKLISRKLLISNIKYCNTDISMSEDVNIMLPCLLDCKRLVVVEDGYYYHYRLVKSSIAHSYSPKLLSNLELTDKTFRNIFAAKDIPNYEQQMDREFVMMLLIILKNVLRTSDMSTSKGVRSIFFRPDVREKVMSTKVDITSKSNKLLYTCIKHPNTLTVSICKFIINMYDRKTN